jgi:hopanoid biosynthesis associated radical SAM protein HpnH
MKDCLDAVDECGAPVVAIAGWEPLLHKELPQIVEAILARGKFVYLCTNALLLENRIEQYKPHKNFSWDIHLDGDKDMHDHAVSQTGVYERAVSAIKDAKQRGFRVCINATLFDGAKP